MKVPFKFVALPVDHLRAWLDQFPDGDYTIGRGADPRSAAERAADPDGSIARQKLDERRVRPAAKKSKRKPSAPPQAAE